METIDGFVYREESTEWVAVGWMTIKDKIHILEGYHGTDNDLVIPDFIDVIGRHSLWCLNTHSASLSFTPDGQMITRDNPALKSIRIPKNVHLIEEEAFEEDDSLEEIYFDNKLILLGNNCFKDCSPKIIKIHDEDVTIDDLDFLKMLKKCGMDIKNLESCSDEIRLLIETDEL